jgi:hypothetical protein
MTIVLQELYGKKNLKHGNTSEDGWNGDSKITLKAINKSRMIWAFCCWWAAPLLE